MFSANDLITKPEQTVSGFVWQATQKTELSTSYISKAINAKKRQLEFADIEKIFEDKELYDFIVGACCLSRKSLNHISKEAQTKIFTSLIDFSQVPQTDYFDELVYRFLLTSGDSMGGSMRNLVGQSAQIMFTDQCISYLQSESIKYSCQYSLSGKVTAISWENKLLIFDKKPKFINKSIDFILLAKSCSIENPSDYVACGELKGGIDPAGADEHWKTARSALERIHSAFKDRHAVPPKLYFVGAAIEKSMAEEIEQLLVAEWLAGAANLNVKPQINAIIKDMID